MFGYLFFTLFLSLLTAVLVWFFLSSNNKWLSSIYFMIAGFTLGACLLALNTSYGFWLDSSNYFVFGGLVYLITYYSFYLEFKSKFKIVKIGFWQYMMFMTKHLEVLIKEASVENEIRNMFRDEFYSDQAKEMTKIWYEDKPEKSPFWVWFGLFLNFFYFAGMMAFVASQNSFIDLLYAFAIVSDEMKLLFWGIIIFTLGLFIKAYIDWKSKK